MIIQTKYIFSKEELTLLKGLIGKSLIEIYSSRVDEQLDWGNFNVLDPINLTFKNELGFIIISADYDETKFGDDFIKTHIQQSFQLLGINPRDQIGKRLPPLHTDILPEFKIVKIEIYGDSYIIESDNTDRPVWQVEIENPGECIFENIEIENKLLLYSDSRRILLKPIGPVPILTITTEDNLIDLLLIDKNIDGIPITKLKHIIE